MPESARIYQRTTADGPTWWFAVKPEPGQDGMVMVDIDLLHNLLLGAGWILVQPDTPTDESPPQ